MTRSQRRIRARKLGQLRAEDRTFAAGLNLAENPNRGKRHAARMTDAFLVELARDTARAYSPLTVATLSRKRNGARYPERRTDTGAAHPASYSSYTV